MWQGHDNITDTVTDQASVGWILGENWWPYQRPSFVTPPFAGYVSGHSTYSRAAAEVLTLITGNEFFPGGYGEFVANRNEFLVFEEGPSEDIRLQWATYRDASDQCSLSRIWGGIHPPADDIPGRIMGQKIGIEAFNKAKSYFDSQVIEEEEEPSTDIVLFPIPVLSELTVSLPEEAIADSTINIYSFDGSLLLSFDADPNNPKLSLETLSDGMYIVHVITGDQKVEKIIVKL